jgi:hypothetical protein
VSARSKIAPGSPSGISRRRRACKRRSFSWVSSPMPGGPGRSPARASHGSGRAGFPHPARQVTDLLHEARASDGPPAPGAGSAS